VDTVVVDAAQAVAQAGPVVAGDEHRQRPADKEPLPDAEQVGRAPVGLGDDPGPVGDQLGDRAWSNSDQ
jgi:hypothetical protein